MSKNCCARRTPTIRIASQTRFRLTTMSFTVCPMVHGARCSYRRPVTVRLSSRRSLRPAAQHCNVCKNLVLDLCARRLVVHTWALGRRAVRVLTDPAGRAAGRAAAAILIADLAALRVEPALDLVAVFPGVQ